MALLGRHDRPTTGAIATPNPTKATTTPEYLARLIQTARRVSTMHWTHAELDLCMWSIGAIDVLGIDEPTVVFFIRVCPRFG